MEYAEWHPCYAAVFLVIFRYYVGGVDVNATLKKT